MSIPSLLARVLRVLAAPALVVAVAACSGDAPAPSSPTTPPPPPPLPGTLAVAVAPASLSLTQGQGGSAGITITRGGSFAGQVDLLVEGAPSGLTATLSATAVPAGSTTATLTLQSAATLTPGTVSLIIRARGTGVTDATATLAVTVVAAPPPPPTGTIALARSGGISVQQGQSGSATVTLTRGGGFAGAVELSAEGIPGGVTVSIAPTTLAAGAVSATVTVTTSAAAGVGTDGVTIRARGSGVSDATVLIPLTVTAPPAGAITLGVAPAALTLTQGQSGTVAVTLTRLNGYTGTVTLTSAVPAGVTATFNPSTVTGTTSTLTLTAGATMPAGTYSIGIGATGPGIAGVSATVSLTVTASPPPSGGAIAWTYCGNDRPLFFAVQDGTGTWTRVTPGTDGVFRFDIAQARGGVATVQANGAANTLNVYYLTKAEIEQFGTQFCDDPAARALSGTVAGAAATDLVYVGFGNRVTTVVPSQSTAWSLANVQGGARDLIASRSTLALSGLNVNYALAGLIIRRGVRASAGSSAPVLDFSGTEAFAPAAANVTLANAGGELLTLITQFTTGTGSGTPIALEVSPSTSTTRTWRGVPASRTQTGDYHTLVASATASAQNSLIGRQVTFYSAAVTDRTLTFGPALGAVGTTAVGGGGMVRLRTQYTIQTAYDRFYVAQYQQSSNGRINQVQASRGYLQSAASYDIAVPDLSGVAGWQSSYGLASGVSATWTFAAQGWTGGTSLSNISDGASVLSATSGGQIVP